MGGPNSPYGALGSPHKNSHNLFYQNFKDPRIYFADYFSHSFLYEPYERKHIEAGLKNLNVSTEKMSTIFTLVSPGISIA
jgi:hypothetical protein